MLLANIHIRFFRAKGVCDGRDRGFETREINGRIIFITLLVIHRKTDNKNIKHRFRDHITYTEI